MHRPHDGNLLSRRHIATSRLRALPFVATVIAVLTGLVSVSCGEEKHPLLSGSTDPERFPTMRTTNVSTLISDSGITRYKITSPLWLMFEEARTPQWRFPKGLHLEKYDDFFRKDATVDCDSATFFKEQQLWRLDGYVKIANMAGEKFLTPQLFWDQRHRKIYSDSFIHIEKSDRTIEGYGFESDERMTNYRVLNVSGIFPVEDFKKQPGDSASGSRVQPQAPSLAPAGPPAAIEKSPTDSTTRRSRMQRPMQPGPPRQTSQPAPAPAAVHDKLAPSSPTRGSRPTGPRRPGK